MIIAKNISKKKSIVKMLINVSFQGKNALLNFSGSGKITWWKLTKASSKSTAAYIPIATINNRNTPYVI